MNLGWPRVTNLLVLALLLAATSCRGVLPLSEAEKTLLADIGKEITAVEGQIAEATSESARYEGGLIKVMTELRIAYLKNSLAMLNQKKYAVEHRVDGKYTLEGKVVPPAKPDEAKLAELAKDIAAQQAQLQAAKEEDAQYSGGLIKAMIGSRIATIENTIALLDQRRLAERYGIPYLLPEKGTGSPQPSHETAPQPPLAERVAPVPEPAAPCAVSIDRFEIKPRAGDYKRNYADLILHVKNLSESRVKAWRLGVQLDDTFGSELLTVKLTDGSADLAPGATGRAAFEFEDNQFIKDEPYDKLLSYSVENLKATIATCDVSFSE